MDFSIAKPKITYPTYTISYTLTILRRHTDSQRLKRQCFCGRLVHRLKILFWVTSKTNYLKKIFVNP